MNPTLKRIAEIFDEIREYFPCEAELDGKIYYANGNNGTDFDWNVNGRLCEFMMYHENEYGYIKFCMNKDDTALAYVYPDGGMSPTETLCYDFPEGSAFNLAVAMYAACDVPGNWDCSIENITVSPEKEETYRPLFEGKK